MKFDIPKGVEPPKRKEPKTLLIYGLQKSGKTALTAKLPRSLIIEHEPDGSAAVACRSIKVYNPNHIIPLFQQLKTDDSIDFIIVDSCTKWDEWSEVIGTYKYMKKPQGKRFNVVNGAKLNHLDDQFDTVHSIGEGYGYRYSRDVMREWYNAAINTGKTIIFLAHVKDKFVEAGSGDVVETKTIDLTGKVKSIYASHVDAIALVKRTAEESFLVFETLGDAIAGSRYAYLNGEMLIGETAEDGELGKTHWETIFPSIKK